MHKDTARLTILLACAGLVTSRLGLVLHELVGHGGVALALGGGITRVKLFWFGGGWVQTDGYASLPGTIAVRMGGIASELAIGTALWIAPRSRDGLGSRIVRAVGATLIVHATWYLATGTWYGYGDGRILFELLGSWRLIVALGAGTLGCAAGFFGARVVFDAIRLSTPRYGWIFAVVVAIGLNAGLAIGELEVRNDQSYASMKTPEGRFVASRELREFQKHEGRDASPDVIAAKRAELEAKYRVFPLGPVLAVLGLIAVIAGCVASVRRGATRAPVSRRLALWAAVIASLSLALVIAIDAVTV